VTSLRSGVKLVLMKKKIPNILANQKHVVSNFLYKNDGLIIGDTEQVLDIKNQYIINTYQFVDFHNRIKNLNLAYGTVSADTYDGCNDFSYYPFIEIKRKGSGLNDIFKKNNHLPCGFFCIHDWEYVNRRNFDFYDSFHKYTNKCNPKKTIKVSSGSICIFPLSNNLQFNPFRSIDFANKHDLNLFSLGKNKKKVIDKIKKFANKTAFKFKIKGLNKIDKDNQKKYNLLKSVSFNANWKFQEFEDFVQELKKSGANLEFKNQSFKSFEEYDNEELRLFQKELDLLKKQKNKKKGDGDIIKCHVENGMYDVYHTDVGSSTGVLVLKK